jgi:hypothetical protein
MLRFINNAPSKAAAIAGIAGADYDSMNSIPLAESNKVLRLKSQQVFDRRTLPVMGPISIA